MTKDKKNNDKKKEQDKKYYKKVRPYKMAYKKLKYQLETNKITEKEFREKLELLKMVLL